MSDDLPVGYFDDLYADADDPWGFRDRWYERRKRALTVAMLPRARFRSAYEPACSIGVLSADLAERCDRLRCSDVATAALAAARERLAAYPHVTVERASLTDPWPPGPFELVVLSEVLYYLTPATLTGVLVQAVAALEPGGVLLAAHWRHPVADYPQSGDAVHDALAGVSDLSRTASYVDDDARIETFERSSAPRSVAVVQGLVDPPAAPGR